MKYLLIPFFLIAVLNGDQITKKTLGCPNVSILQKAPVASSDAMELSLFVIANGCEVLSPRDSIEAIGYDPLNANDLYVKIIYKKTGDYLFVPSASIIVEQDGKKSSYRF